MLKKWKILILYVFIYNCFCNFLFIVVKKEKAMDHLKITIFLVLIVFPLISSPMDCQDGNGKIVYWCSKWSNDIKQEAHWPQRSPEKTSWKSIHMIIPMLIKRGKNSFIYFMCIEWFFFWTNLNPLHPRRHCGRFGWN